MHNTFVKDRCRLINKSSKLIHRIVWFDTTIISRTLRISALALLIILFIAQRADAVPISGSHIGYEWQEISSFRAGRSLSEYDTNFYYYPWWVHSYFNEGDNIEWIYIYLEGRYMFLDDTLYRLLGGSYSPGTIGYPWRRDFEYYSRPATQDIVTQWVDFWGRFTFFKEPAQPGDRLFAYIGDMPMAIYTVSEEGWYVIRIYADDPSTDVKEGAVAGDIITFTAQRTGTELIYPTETLPELPRWTFHTDRIRVDINAIPEPSAIALFGLVALRILRVKNQAN